MTDPVKEIANGVTRLIAPNPSPMTYWGTNTYILNDGQTAVIDPGPDDKSHMERILSATNGQIDMILVTHSHLDHSPLAKPLSELTDAPVLAFGHSKAGQSPLMATLEATGDLQGGEGLDMEFTPDRILYDGEAVGFGENVITAIHTPGHLSNHMCFKWQDQLFSGDHVMDWATSMVSPPDGDLGDFMKSCEKLLDHKALQYHPGHGDPVQNPIKRVQALIQHRKSRETQILSALGKSPKSASIIAAEIYTDVNPALLGAAARNVFAHLIDLHSKGVAETTENLNFLAHFTAP